MTRLEALNQMLVAIGEAPVSSESSQHPDVLVARHILDREIQTLQNIGWWFNTDTSVELSPDVYGDIIVPANTLKIDPVDEYSNYVQRGQKLYNQDTSTFTFTESVKCKIIFALNFTDMPIAAQNFVADTAAYKLHVSEVGDENKLRHLLSYVTESRRVLRAEDISAGDYNSKTTPSALRMLAGVRPYRSGY